MDKREALEIFLKLHDECLAHECKDCVFSDPLYDDGICILNYLCVADIAMRVRNKLKSIEEKQEESRIDKKQEKPSVSPANVEVKTTFYAKAPISAEELEKQLKALLPKKLALEPFPKEDRAIKMPESSKSDNVNRPKHYCKGGLECIQVIKAQLTPEQNKGYLYGNVLKYMWRWPDKNGLEDLRKAKHYLEWLIEEVKNNG